MMKTKKKWTEMTTAELREATKEFDRPFAFEKTKPLTAAQKRLHAKARRGRPKNGLGADKIQISLEAGLRQWADAEAKRRGVTRSRLIAMGLNEIRRKSA